MDFPLKLAQEKELIAMGIDAPPPDHLQDRLFDEVQKMAGFSRNVKIMLETCTKCGACAKGCHSYLATEDGCNIPSSRAGIFRAFYQKNFTLLGKFLAQFSGGRKITTSELEKWIVYAYQCNMCRRCAYYCPFGIDTAEITMAMRYCLAKVGIVPRFTAGIAANVIKMGNNVGILKPAIIDCCEFLEDELREETGREIKIPIDKPNAEIIYIPSSTEFLHNVDTLMGVAKLFHALDLNWTISSSITEAANYGLFIDLDLLKYHNKRIFDAVCATGAKLVVQGECGHGWRVAKMYSEGANGPVPFKVMHILELAADNLAKLSLEKVEMRATLHDPCNYARAGDLAEAPRQILRACVSEFVEMTPNRELNYCCGGGSGLLMEEMMEVRMKLAQKKAEQLQVLGRLDAVIAPCASCKAQFPHVIKHYGLEIEKTAGLMEIMGMALRL